jgi:hypothetical protein
MAVKAKKRDSERIEFHPFDSAPNQPGNISIWAMHARFNDSDVLIVNGEAMGKIQIITKRNPL